MIRKIITITLVSTFLLNAMSLSVFAVDSSISNSHLRLFSLQHRGGNLADIKSELPEDGADTGRDLALLDEEEATEENLKLILKMTKGDDWFVCDSALKAISSFIQANKSLATEENYKLVLKMSKDKDKHVRYYTLESILPLFIRVNKSLAIEKNLKYFLDMLKDKDKHVRRLILESVIPSFLQANRSLATEENLKLVLKMLKDEDQDVSKDALKTIFSFITTNRNSFTEENLELVLEMLKDNNWHVRNSTLEAISLFIQVNNSLATEENLLLVLEMLKDKNSAVHGAALKAITLFIQVNESLAAKENLKLVLGMLKDEDQDARDFALEAISSFIQANRASFTKENLKLVLKILKDEDPDIRRSASEAMPFFIQANRSLATEENLKLVLEMLKDENWHVRNSALEAITLFIEVNKDSFTEENLECVLEMLKNKNSDARAYALKAIPLFIRANKSLATEENQAYVLKMLKDESSYVRRTTVKVLGIIGDTDTLRKTLLSLKGKLRASEDYITKVRLLDVAADIIIAVASKDHPTLSRSEKAAAALSCLIKLINDESVSFSDFDKIIKEHILLNKVFKTQATSGGKIHLEIDPKSKEADSIRDLCEVLSLNTQAHSWADTTKECLEIHLSPSPSTGNLTETIKAFVQLDIFAPFDLIGTEIISETDGTLTETLKTITLQPSLRVDGLFWDESEDDSEDKVGELKEEPKLLALSLLIANPYIVKYIDEIASSIDTYGPIVEGGGVLYDQTGKRISHVNNDRADLWGLAAIDPDDAKVIEQGEFTNAFSKVYSRYHLIGDIILRYIKNKDKPLDDIEPLDRELCQAAEQFLKYMKDTLIQQELYEAFTTSWRRGNWPELKKLLEKVQEAKKKLTLNQDLIDQLPDIEEVTLIFEIELILTQTTNLILFFHLKDYASRLKTSGKEKQEKMELLRKAINLAGFSQESADKIYESLLGAQGLGLNEQDENQDQLGS